MKTTKQKKASLKTLQRKADRMLQIYYVTLNPKCEVCGHQTSEMHHFVPKSQSNNLRYDSLNLVPLCRGCHFRHHNAGDPYVLSTVINKRGNHWAEDLQLRRHNLCKLNREYLEAVIAKFKQIEKGGER